MANQYTKLTRANILRKINRKRNPVTSLVQLADEFDYPVYFDERSGSTSASRAFREKVKGLVGDGTYKKIRNEKSVNLAYR